MQAKHTTKINDPASTDFDPRRKLAAATAAEKRIIDNFLSRFAVTAAATRDEWRKAEKVKATVPVVRSRIYWDNVTSAIRWLRSVNRQRKVRDG